MGTQPPLQDEQEEEGEGEGGAESRVRREYMTWLNNGDVRNQAGKQTIRGSMHTAPTYNQSKIYYNSAPATLIEWGDTTSSEDVLGTLLRSLVFERMDARLRDVAAAHPFTCNWLFSHPTFEDWNDSRKVKDHHGFLWIKGKPGSGKSVIMKTALEWVKTNRVNEHVASYFFNARAPDELEKSSLGFYRSLTHQLLELYPSMQTSFVKQFASKKRGSKVESWTPNELQEFIHYIVKNVEADRLNIFIDALDEGDEIDVRQLIDFLEDTALGAISSGLSLRICLASRHYPNITIPQSLDLVIDREPGHENDVRTYVRSKLSAFDSQDHQIGFINIQEKVCEQSAGVFLWISLVIPMLRSAFDRGGGISAMIDCLKGIPKKLDDLFHDILDKSRTDAEGMNDSILLFQWVMFAKRQLTPKELFHATNSAANLDPFHNISEARIHRYLVSRSWGLVEVIGTSRPVVQFIHETVRDFLKGRGLAQMVPSISYNVEGASHEILKTACLQCIKQANTASSVERMERSKLFRRLPPLTYAIDHAFEHADDAQGYGLSQREFLERLLLQNNHYHSLWINMFDVFRGFRWRRFKPDTNLLKVLARHGLSNLLRVSIVELIDIDISSKALGLALIPAAASGSVETVRFLIQHGADVNIPGGENGTAPQATSHYRNSGIARLSIEHGGDVNVPKRTYGTALHSASYYGDAEMVALLIEHGTDVNAPGGGGNGTALQVASHFDHIEIARLLIEHGADVNAPGGGGNGTALHVASYLNYVELVELLIEHGAVERP